MFLGRRQIKWNQNSTSNCVHMHKVQQAKFDCKIAYAELGGFHLMTSRGQLIFIGSQAGVLVLSDQVDRGLVRRLSKGKSYSLIGHRLQSGPTLSFSLWLSNFKIKISFGFLVKKIRGRFFQKPKNNLVRSKMMFLAFLQKFNGSSMI